MKVLYIAPDYPNENNIAAHVRANQLLPRLAKQVDLFVFAYSHADQKKGVNKTCFPVKSVSLRSPGVTSVFSKDPVAFFRYAHSQAVEAFIDVINQFKPDIVHFDSIGTFGLFKTLKNMGLECQPKVVLHPHDAVSRLYATQISARKNVLYRMYLRMQQEKILKVEKSLYPEADLCLVDSQEDADFLSSLAQGSNVEVLPLGYDEAVYCQDGNTVHLKQPNILMSGAMRSVQNVESAVRLCKEIMPLVWQKIPEMQVYLVGSSPALEILELKDDHRIHVTGFVDDLASYLRASDVYVCPLKIGSGMRTRTVEALACGCAIVTTPEGTVGIGNDNKAQGLPWLTANNDNEFAQCIVRLYQNSELRSTLKKDVNLLALKYSWATVTDTLVQYYENL